MNLVGDGVLGANGGQVGLGDVDHLVDAASRGVSLQIPKAIRWAGVETDAAVDAAREVFVRGILAGDRRSSGHLGLLETVARRENMWRGEV